MNSPGLRRFRGAVTLRLAPGVRGCAPVRCKLCYSLTWPDRSVRIDSMFFPVFQNPRLHSSLHRTRAQPGRNVSAAQSATLCHPVKSGQSVWYPVKLFAKLFLEKAEGGQFPQKRRDCGTKFPSAVHFNKIILTFPGRIDNIKLEYSVSPAFRHQCS